MALQQDLQKSMSRAAFVAKLRRLADTLEAGLPFSIQLNGARILVPATASFSVEIEREGEEAELEFQLSWTCKP